MSILSLYSEQVSGQVIIAISRGHSFSITQYLFIDAQHQSKFMNSFFLFINSAIEGPGSKIATGRLSITLFSLLGENKEDRRFI